MLWKSLTDKLSQVSSNKYLGWLIFPNGIVPKITITEVSYLNALRETSEIIAGRARVVSKMYAMTPVDHLKPSDFL